MSDNFKVFKNIRSLRAAARNVQFEELQEYVDKLNSVLEEMREEKEKQLEEERLKKEKISTLLELMNQDGITHDDLLNISPVSGKSSEGVRSKAPPKYQFKTKGGEIKTWTGRGRTPNELKEMLDAGESLDKFLIERKEG